MKRKCLLVLIMIMLMCIQLPLSAAATEQEGPAITRHPVSVTTTKERIATFSVEAEGRFFSYQWQYKTPEGEWTDYSGFRDDPKTLQVTAFVYRNGYSYRCVVRDQFGNVAISNPAVLTVEASLGMIPGARMNRHYVGETARFYVIIEGNATSYLWQYRMPESEEWKTYSRTAGDTLLVEAKAYRDGYQYRCLVKDKYGLTKTSPAFTLEIIPNVTIIENPEDITIDAGETAVFSVKAEGAVSYVWEYCMRGDRTWKTFSKTAGSSLQVVAKEYRHGYQYRCQVFDENGKSRVTSAAKLTVVPEIKTNIIEQPKDAEVALGEKAVFTVKAEGDIVEYFWQYRISPTGNWVDYPIYTPYPRLSLAALEYRDGYQYRCLILDNFDRYTISDIATLTIK